MAVFGTTLVAGDSDAVLAVLEHLKGEGVDTVANPDLYVRSYASFGIDEARELRDRAALGGATQRIFVIQSPSLTAEAQNALLKTLEEPAADAAFFLIVAAPDALLPTLRSRAQRLDVDSSAALSSVDPALFLRSLPQERLEMLKPLLDRDEDDRRDISGVVTFLSSLERMLESSGRARDIAAVYRAKKYVSDKGALLKPLLEQVALLTPVLS